MRANSDALSLTHPPIGLDRLRHHIAAILAIAVWLFLCATVLCAALGLIALAASAVDADLTNQALLGLLAALDAPPLHHHPLRPLA